MTPTCARAPTVPLPRDRHAELQPNRNARAIDEAAARYCWENSPISIGDETYSVMIRIEAEFHLDRMRRVLVALFDEARYEEVSHLTRRAVSSCKGV